MRKVTEVHEIKSELWMYTDRVRQQYITRPILAPYPLEAHKTAIKKHRYRLPHCCLTTKARSRLDAAAKTPTGRSPRAYRQPAPCDLRRSLSTGGAAEAPRLLFPCQSAA